MKWIGPQNVHQNNRNIGDLSQVIISYEIYLLSHAVLSPSNVFISMKMCIVITDVVMTLLFPPKVLCKV